MLVPATTLDAAPVRASAALPVAIVAAAKATTPTAIAISALWSLTQFDVLFYLVSTTAKTEMTKSFTVLLTAFPTSLA